MAWGASSDHHHQGAGLSFRYPAQDGDALSDVDLAITAGTITWLTGALGSGTTTMLLAASGLAPRLTGGTRAGTIETNGTDPATRSPLALGVAYLGASPALQLSGIANTVGDEVAVGPMNLGMPRERIARLVSDALDRFGVGHLADRDPSRLSGGETQRVILAALHAASPTTWLLDEPFSALDRLARMQAAAALRALADAGATVVIASDDADAMLGLADRVVVFRDGRPALDGDPDTLLAGEALTATGAGTTDAATLARAAGMAPPFPLRASALATAVPAGVCSSAPDGMSGPSASEAPVAPLPPRVSFRYPGTGRVAQRQPRRRQGDAVGLFGANGAGKSSCCVCNGLEQPTRAT